MTDDKVTLTAQMARAQADLYTEEKERADALQAERDKLAAEVSGLKQRLDNSAQAWSKEKSRAQSAEAKLTALVEITDRITPIPEVLEALAELPDEMNLYLDGAQAGAGWEIGPITVGDIRALASLSRTAPIDGPAPNMCDEPSSDASVSASPAADVVRQREDDDCTICAIAMATGLPYERVMEVAANACGGYRYREAQGTMSPKGVLIDLGFEAERIMFGGVRGSIIAKLLWGRRAILSVPSLNGYDGHHDVYWDGTSIRDPGVKTTYAPDALPSLVPIFAVVLNELALAAGQSLTGLAQDGSSPQNNEAHQPADDNHKALVEALLAADHAITGIELARIRGADDGREGVRLAKLVVNLKAAAQNLAAAPSPSTHGEG